MPDWFWRRLTHGTQHLRQHASWAPFAKEGWGELCLEAGRDHPLYAKQGRTITPWDVESDGRSLSLFLKSHYSQPRWNGLLAALFPTRDWSPALQEWTNLVWAHEHDIPVPLPVIAGQIVRPWGKLQSFLAVENLVGMVALHEAIPIAEASLDATAFRTWKKGIAVELARLSHLLHDRRRFHKDLYLCHFFIAEEDCRNPPVNWRGRVRMIDLHRLAHHPVTWRWWQAKDLGQLLFSSFWPGVDDRDRLAFWRAYLGPARRGWYAKMLAKVVRFRAKKYLRHEQKDNRRDPQPTA